MESVMKYTKTYTQYFCAYSSLKVYETSMELDQDLHGGRKEIEQQLHTGFCLYSLLEVYEISKEMTRSSTEDFCLC